MCEGQVTRRRHPAVEGSGYLGWGGQGMGETYERDRLRPFHLFVCWHRQGACCKGRTSAHHPPQTYCRGLEPEELLVTGRDPFERRELPVPAGTGQKPAEGPSWPPAWVWPQTQPRGAPCPTRAQSAEVAGPCHLPNTSVLECDLRGQRWPQDQVQLHLALMLPGPQESFSLSGPFLTCELG